MISYIHVYSDLKSEKPNTSKRQDRRRLDYVEPKWLSMGDDVKVEYMLLDTNYTKARLAYTRLRRDMAALKRLGKLTPLMLDTLLENEAKDKPELERRLYIRIIGHIYQTLTNQNETIN